MSEWCVYTDEVGRQMTRNESEAARIAQNYDDGAEVRIEYLSNSGNNECERVGVVDSDAIEGRETPETCTDVLIDETREGLKHVVRVNHETDTAIVLDESAKAYDHYSGHHASIEVVAGTDDTDDDTDDDADEFEWADADDLRESAVDPVDALDDTEPEPAPVDETRTAVLTASIEALGGFSPDATGCGRYNRSKLYDEGFFAAMNVLRDVPLDERPDEITREVDRACSLVRSEGREAALDDLVARLFGRTAAEVTVDA